MSTLKLLESFADFKDYKNINRETMMSVIQDVFITTLENKYEVEGMFNVIINAEKGDLEIWWNKTIVENDALEDENSEIELKDALKISADFEVGEQVSIEFKLSDFDRRTIVLLGQNLKNRIKDLEKNTIYNKYKTLIGNIVSAEVYQVWTKELLALDEDGNELIIPKSELIPKDFYKKGDMIKGIIAKVELKNHVPRIIISRTANEFLAKLMENEIPEILDGLIIIKKIERIPGEKAKIIVESFDDRIDPVGACIGIRGSRIHGIVKELKNENIDVINYTEDMTQLITRCLAPAKVNKVEIDAEKKTAKVFLKSDQVSLAIGRGGSNIKLTSRLTGLEIDAYKDEVTTGEEDVDLSEFEDEIEEWIIDELKKIGCDTAKSVLELSIEELVSRTDLEEDTITDVVSILKKEFE